MEAAHKRFNCICQMAPMCAPSSKPNRHLYRIGAAPYWVAMSISTVERVRLSWAGPFSTSKLSHRVWGSGPHLIHDSFGSLKPTAQTTPRSVQPILHSSRRSVPILYNRPPLFPKNCPSHWGFGPRLVIQCGLRSMRTNDINTNSQTRYQTQHTQDNKHVTVKA